MMDRMIIKNVTVVLPEGILENRNVLVKQGKIADLDYKVQPSEACVDGQGNYLLAGFIDLHVHGGGGADFMDETVDSFETAVRAHRDHGTTLLYPTAMAATFEDLRTFLEVFQKFAATSELGKLTPGVHLEGPYFFGANSNSRGAQKGDVLRLPDPEEVEKLLAVAKGCIHRWDASPELEGACWFGNKMVEEGILCAAAHTDATAAEAVLGFQNGFSHVTHFYNATSLHRKREQTVYAGVVEATYLNDNVTVELIGDGCHIPKEDVYLAKKIKGAEQVSIITDGTRLSGTDAKTGKLGSKKNGTDVIVEDGVAKLPDRTFFAGSIATMDRCLQVLCGKYGVDVSTASVMLSLAPAKRMGLEKTKGSIAIGKDADLVLVDRNWGVKQVFVGGEPVGAEA